MNKTVKIVLVVIAVLIVVVIGAIVIMNATHPEVGIDNSMTNENGKKGNLNIDSSRVLTLYFSQSGNTQKLAKLISDKVGGDFIRIETIQTYPTTYTELTAFAKNEKDKNIHPKLKELDINLKNYDYIFIGYPIWWYTLPMPLYTFFDNYDLSGKTIIPFNTHEGSGNCGTYETIKDLEPNSVVLDGLAIRGGDMASDQTTTVEDWLNKLGY